MATPYTLDLTSTQVNAAVNAAHDSGDPITSGSTKLVQSAAVYNEIITKIRTKIGWAVYEDSQYTSVSPLASSNANTQLTINGLGAGTTTTYLPTNVTELWNTTSNKIVADQLGDAYDVRLDFKADPATASDYAEIVFDIGDGGGTLPVVSRTITFAKVGASSFSIGFPIAALATFMTNGCKIYIDTSGSGDAIDIYDISLFIKRDFNNIS